MGIATESDGEPLLDTRREGVLPRRVITVSVLLMVVACSCVAVHAIRVSDERRTPNDAAIDAAIRTDSEAVSLIQVQTDSQQVQTSSLIQVQTSSLIQVQPLHSVGNFIAALGSTDAESGNGAQKWGLWEGDPGSDGRYPNTLEASAPSWYNPLDFWIEGHGLIMPNPKPLPAGEYKVSGDTTLGGAKLLTVSGDGSWVLQRGVTLDDVTHHPCKSNRYMGIEGSGCNANSIAKCTDSGSPVEYKVLIVNEQTVDSAPDGTLPKP